MQIYWMKIKRRETVSVKGVKPLTAMGTTSITSSLSTESQGILINLVTEQNLAYLGYFYRINSTGYMATILTVHPPKFQE